MAILTLFSADISSNLTHIVYGTACSSSDVKKSYDKYFKIIITALHNPKFSISKESHFDIVFDEKTCSAKFIVYLEYGTQTELFPVNQVDAYKEYLNHAINNAIKINVLARESAETGKNTQFIEDTSLSQSGDVIVDKRNNKITMSPEVRKISEEVDKLCAYQDRDTILDVGGSEVLFEKMDKLKNNTRTDTITKTIFRGTIECLHKREKLFEIFYLSKNKCYRAHYNDEKTFDILNRFFNNSKIIELSGYIKVSGKIVQKETTKFELIAILNE